MAKKRRAETQGMSYRDLTDVMALETASILTDYVRQYIGTMSLPAPGSGIFVNWDRVLRTQVYQELAWYDLYDEVERDPHISAILRTLKLTVASRTWEIVPSDESGRAKAVADFVKEVLEGMEDFTQDLYEMLDAEGKGFSVSEVIWDVGYETRVKKLMHRPQRRFQFDAVTRQPRLRTEKNPYFGDPLPERKFIVHRVSSTYENPFGDALDQSLYWMWWFKRTVLKFWMTHLDVASAPVPVIKIPPMSDSVLKAEADDLVGKIRRGAAIRLPANLELAWAESQTAQGTAQSYERFVAIVNSEMTKCVLGQVLTTEGAANSGVGSRALGETHADVLAMRTAFSSRALEATLNGTLIKWLVDANYGQIDEYPKFRFEVDRVDDRAREAQIVKTLSDAGYKATREWVEETFQLELEEKVEQPAALNPAAQAPEQDGDELDENGNPMKKKVDNMEGIEA